MASFVIDFIKALVTKHPRLKLTIKKLLYRYPKLRIALYALKARVSHRGSAQRDKTFNGIDHTNAVLRASDVYRAIDEEIKRREAVS